MWWHQPRLRDFPPLLPDNILDVAVRAYAVAEVGGLSGYGPERGRNFERLFYGICERRGVHLTERAGSRSLAGQRSASGFQHEVDGATRSLDCITHWELKHLTSELNKNELLVFNGKGMDFLFGSSQLYARVPIRRFLLSGADVGDECRHYSVQWGIMLIEPRRLPLALIYEAVARGETCGLSPQDREAVRHQLAWACRPLQHVVRDLAQWGAGEGASTRFGPAARKHAHNIAAIQDEIGANVIDSLAEHYPDWVDEIANDTWAEVGGW
jgi:hypothetical protein